jgi:hypothetical protein
MKTEIRDRWITALESGEYTQTTGRLRIEGDKFCCLGVLCMLVAPERFVRLTDTEYCIPPIGDSTDETVSAMLPDSILEMVGLSKGEQRELWRRNDGLTGNRRHTFPEIAQYIRENIPCE